MSYRLKPGVVLFRMFDQMFLFPSRKADARISVLIILSPELAVYLQRQDETPAEDGLSAESQERLIRLEKLGYVEEY